jgi:hypothetical protein
MGGSPADFGKLIAAETDKWARVIPVGQHQGGVIGAVKHLSMVV